MTAYRVVNFDETSGQLAVAFAEDLAPLTIDVPIENGLYLAGDALHQYITGFIPTWHIERQTQIKAGVANKEELKTLVEATAAVELPVVSQEDLQAKENEKMWTDIQKEKDVIKVLVKYSLLDSDPTEIPVHVE
jgi:hypothetical protein